MTSLGSFLRYLNRLEEVRAPILTDDQWRDHILRLVKEWEEFNLIVSLKTSSSAAFNISLPSVHCAPVVSILNISAGNFDADSNILAPLPAFSPWKISEASRVRRY